MAAGPFSAQIQRALAFFGFTPTQSAGVANTEATSALTGAQPAINPAAKLIRLDNATLLTIQGIAAGEAGQIVTFVSTGAGQVNFEHQSGSATEANRLINTATSGVTPLAPGVGTATYQYDGTAQRWRLVAHDQGDWIDVAFNAADYVGNGSQTWTVAAGDAQIRKYYLRGRILHYHVLINTSTVGGTPNTDLRVQNVGYTFPTTQRTPCSIADNGTQNIGLCDALGTSSLFRVQRIAAANWSAATDTTFVWFNVAVEVD